MKELQLKIISPEKMLFQGAVLSVILPGTDGEFGILPDHAPLIASLRKGDISYEIEKGSPEIVTIESGFVEVKKNVVTICVE
uniref:ATP synthase F1 subunit epsilon n=1 Tax=uncultured Dysgonomonas sp. TaxID=206096 RepID=UPI00261EAB3C|nr:ATP synthase F1 subunit epsilon [uncultured Dysgonomonas sp.]